MQPTEFCTNVVRPIECAKEAWQLIKPNYWLLFAVLLIGALIGAFSAYILIGAMVCGIMYCYLRQIDGYPVNFEDLWKGFSFFLPSLPVALMIFVPTVLWLTILFTTMYLPIVMSVIADERPDPDRMLSIMLTALLIDSAVAIFMVCLHTLLTFSFPLVVDRRLTGLTPALVSARAVLKNLKGICGLIGVNFVLVLAGELACGIGLYLVLPLLVATNLVAYRKIFPALYSPNLNPPPPNAYSGLR